MPTHNVCKVRVSGHRGLSQHPCAGLGVSPLLSMPPLGSLMTSLPSLPIFVVSYYLQCKFKTSPHNFLCPRRVPWSLLPMFMRVFTNTTLAARPLSGTWHIPPSVHLNIPSQRDGSLPTPSHSVSEATSELCECPSLLNQVPSDRAGTNLYATRTWGKCWVFSVLN